MINVKSALELNFFSYFTTKTYVVGTLYPQGDINLLSTQNVWRMHQWEKVGMYLIQMNKF